MKLKLLIFAILAFFQHNVLADIATDGSVGPALPITAIGDQFTIGENLGRPVGNNLFHSFQEFSIKAGETATFTGVNTIQNVISRVTGGEVSTINGTLESKVESANFYFINPAGIVFGEDAQVNVPASFHVSTADEIILKNKATFSAAFDPEKDSSLNVASPEAFGFTPDQFRFSSGKNGSLEIIGDGDSDQLESSRLEFNKGTDVSFSASSIHIQDQLITKKNFDSTQEPGIHLNLSAVDSTRIQTIPITGLTDTATGGELVIENSDIRVSGIDSGRLSIRAGSMIANKESQLSANNKGVSDMGGDDGINIHVNSLILEKATLRSNADEAGNAGEIFVDVDNTLQLLSGGEIISSNKEGTSSNIKVYAGELTIDGAESEITIVGGTGKILIDVDQSLILNEGQISTGSQEIIPFENSVATKNNSAIKSADLDITAGQLTIQGDKAFIESNNNSPSEAGDVTITVSELINVLNGGGITAINFGQGDAGNVMLTAGLIVIDGQGNENTVISSRAAEGNPGSVDITINTFLKILDSGQIDTTNIIDMDGDGGSDGGNIFLRGGQWAKLDNAVIKTSALSPNSNTKAGNIDIKIPVLILDNGKILAEAESQDAQEGNININATQIVASRGGFNTRDNFNPIFEDFNEIITAPNGNLVATNPVLNIVGTLVSISPPSLDHQRISQDPCAHVQENSLRRLGHGGAPAFQHGENYLMINRFNENERKPNPADMLQTTSSINSDNENIAAECARAQQIFFN